MARKTEQQPKLYFDKVSKLVFMQDEKGVFFPFLYDYDEVKGQGKLFLENNLYKDLFNFVEYVRRRVDKRTGDFFSIPLFVYQWIGLIMMVDAILSGNAEKFLFAWSRQGGKSEIIKIIGSYAPVFLPEYMEIPLERFYLVLGSYKEDAVKKLSAEVKPYLYKAIEFYNQSKEDKLVYKKDDSKMIDDIYTVEINKVFKGQKKSIPYSLYKAITCGSTQDGLSAHALVIDEAGLIYADLFETSVAPFTTTTGGTQFIFGVPNSQADSLFIAKYNNKYVEKVIYDWEKIYRFRKLTNVKLAEQYKRSVESVLNEKGKNSPFVQWNYYLNPYHASGKFITEHLLQDLDIMKNKHISGAEMKPSGTDKLFYNVAGFDTSIKHDYKSLTIGKCRVTDYNYKTEVTAMYTFNKNKNTRMSIEQLAEEVLKKCIEYKIDVFCFDATSHGLAFIQMFIKFMKKYEVVISLCPYTYTSMSKSRLFSNLEMSVYEQRIKLLERYDTWESEKLIEELLYLERKVSKQNNSVANYSAPPLDDCSDDHANSLALFNIGVKELLERVSSKDTNKREFDDGINRFSLYITKFRKLNAKKKKDKEEMSKESLEKYKLRLEKRASIQMDSWCDVL